MKFSAKNLILLSMILMNIVDQPAPEVTIEQGVLTGRISKDGRVHEYVGIPYATTNVEYRFQAPLPAPKWKGVFRAVEEKSCPQKSILAPLGTFDEDCLKINVFVPAITTTKRIPVMINIHGGAFILGSGGTALHSPNFLVKHDVILVTFNYRLGALGFLCLGIEEAPGNAGLKDQIAAIRWVKKNIAAFGGDPDNITVFGESAGATSTSLMIATDATNGLFNRAIVQSGSSVANWAINKNPVEDASLLAKAMGFNSKDPFELYKFFSTAAIQDLINAKTKKPWNVFFETDLIYLPCVEKALPGIEPVITDLPYNLIASVNRKNVSIIYGSNDKEGLFLVGEETDERLISRNKGYMFASDLEFSSEAEAASVSKKVNEFYFGSDPISMKKILNVSEIYTHLYFEMPAIMESEAMIEYSDKPIYNYQFKYDGYRNLVKFVSGFRNQTGACHADENLYLFDGWIWPFRIHKDDQVIIDRMTILWTNFAKFGDPTPDDSTFSVRWTPSKKNDLKFLYIDKELTLGPMPNKKAYEMWKEIYTKHRVTKQRSDN